MARAHANPPLAKRLTAKGFLAQNHATFLILLIDQLVLTRENNSLIFLTTDSVCAGLMPYRVNRVLPQASTRSTVITLVIWLSVSPNYCWDVKTLDCMQTAHIYFWRQLLKSDQRAIWKSESSEEERKWDWGRGSGELATYAACEAWFTSSSVNFKSQKTFFLQSIKAFFGVFSAFIIHGCWSRDISCWNSIAS